MVQDSLTHISASTTMPPDAARRMGAYDSPDQSEFDSRLVSSDYSDPLELGSWFNLSISAYLDPTQSHYPGSLTLSLNSAHPSSQMEGEREPRGLNPKLADSCLAMWRLRVAEHVLLLGREYMVGGKDRRGWDRTRYESVSSRRVILLSLEIELFKRVLFQAGLSFKNACWKVGYPTRMDVFQTLSHSTSSLHFFALCLHQGHFYDHLLASLDRSGVAYNGIDLSSSNSPVPLLAVREFTANLAEGQPEIGINFKEAPAGHETELEVESVEEGSQASGAGLHKGAVVVAVGGTPVHTLAEFRAELNLCKQRALSTDSPHSDTASEGSGSSAMVEAAMATPGYRPCIVRFEDRGAGSGDPDDEAATTTLRGDEEAARKDEEAARRVLAHAFANNHRLNEVEYVVLKVSSS